MEYANGHCMNCNDPLVPGKTFSVNVKLFRSNTIILTALNHLLPVHIRVTPLRRDERFSEKSLCTACYKILNQHESARQKMEGQAIAFGERTNILSPIGKEADRLSAEINSEGYPQASERTKVTLENQPFRSRRKNIHSQEEEGQGEQQKTKGKKRYPDMTGTGRYALAIKNLHYGKPYIAVRAIGKTKAGKVAIVKHVFKTIKKEIAAYKKIAVIPMQELTLERVSQFRWRNLISELETGAPTLFTILENALQKKRNSKDFARSQHAAFLMCSLLFSREEHRIFKFLPQWMSLQIYKRESIKKLTRSLCRLGLCFGYRGTTQLAARLGYKTSWAARSCRDIIHEDSSEPEDVPEKTVSYVQVAEHVAPELLFDTSEVTDNFEGPDSQTDGNDVDEVEDNHQEEEILQSGTRKRKLVATTRNRENKKDKVHPANYLKPAIKPYKCPKCEKEYVMKGTLKLHMRTGHPVEGPDSQTGGNDVDKVADNHQEEKILQLGRGKRKLVATTRYQENEKDEADPPIIRKPAIKPYKCPKCEKEYVMKGTLKLHIRTRHPAKRKMDGTISNRGTANCVTQTPVHPTTPLSDHLSLVKKNTIQMNSQQPNEKKDDASSNEQTAACATQTFSLFPRRASKNTGTPQNKSSVQAKSVPLPEGLSKLINSQETNWKKVGDSSVEVDGTVISVSHTPPLRGTPVHYASTLLEGLASLINAQQMCNRGKGRPKLDKNTNEKKNDASSNKGTADCVSQTFSLFPRRAANNTGTPKNPGSVQSKTEKKGNDLDLQPLALGEESR